MGCAATVATIVLASCQGGASEIFIVNLELGPFPVVVEGDRSCKVRWCGGVRGRMMAERVG